jgi:hypothetical protein
MGQKGSRRASALHLGLEQIVLVHGHPSSVLSVGLSSPVLVSSEWCGVEEEQLARYAGHGLVGAQECGYASVGEALDCGGEIILAVGLERDASVDDLAAGTIGDHCVLTSGEDVLEHADDDVVVDVGGCGCAVVRSCW